MNASYQKGLLEALMTLVMTGVMTVVLTSVLISVSLIGCTLGPQSSDSLGQQPAAPTKNPTKKFNSTDAILGFDEVNKKVFDNSCSGCHARREQPLLNTYADYFTNLSKIENQVVVLRKMPQKKVLSEEQIALVRLWIDQGAQEFSQKAAEPGGPPAPAPAPAPTAPPATPSAPSTPPQNGEPKGGPPVSWEMVRDSFFEKQCNNCHFTGNKDGISSYDTVETVRATIGTIFYTTTIAPVMPPPPKDWDEKTPNPNQLTRQQKDVLSKWIIDGMK